MDQPKTSDRRALVSRRRFLAISVSSLVAIPLLQACSTPTTPATPAATTAATQAAQATKPAATAATAATQAPAAKAVKNEVVYAQARAIGALDTRRHRTTEEQNIHLYLYDPLVDLDPKSEIRPRLAESWERVDLTTWRFKLRQGVKFHDGEEFTAENVKYTVEQFAKLDPPYYYVNIWGPAWPPTAQVESPTSVLIKTAKPSPILPRLMTRLGMMPIKASQDAKYADFPIASGPYKLVEWKKGESVTLEANPNYWRGAPKIGKVIFRPIPDSSARVAALETGEIDVAWAIPAERGAKLPGSVTTIESPTTSKGEILINFRNPNSPLKDLKVRQALLYAIDGKALVDTILGGKAAVLRGPAPMATYGAVDAGGYPGRDVAKAKQLLAEAGKPNGFDLKMIFTPGEFPKDVEITEAIIGQLSEVGVNVKFEELEGGAYSARRPGPDWDLAANNTGSWTADAEFFIGMTGTQTGFVWDETQKLLAQGSETTDAAKRLELLKQAQKAFWDQVPYLWAFEVVAIHGVNKRIKGAEFIPVNWLLLDKAELTS